MKTMTDQKDKLVKHEETRWIRPQIHSTVTSTFKPLGCLK